MKGQAVKFLEVTSPNSMEPADVIAWSKHTATAAAQACADARTYFDRMRHHYNNITRLLERVQELQREPTPDWQDEAREIVDAFEDIIEAMNALQKMQFDEPANLPSLDDDEAELMRTPEGEAAAAALEAEASDFLEAYFKHKARLGLDTQEQVAQLTGISRRHISAIERGKHRPQFRTLKRIADAFGIGVKELMTSH